jgi:glycosyltransferase involved in cell wall biosynthesis
LNIVHWQTSPLIRYGDSSNKSFEYFAAGRPVLFTTRPGYSVVERFQCGFTANDQKPESIAKAINECLYLSVDERAALCRNARSAAEEYDFKKLTEKLIEIIETIKNN